MTRIVTPWVYGQRIWIELMFVIGIIGLLIYLQVKTASVSIIIGELVEPVMVAMDIKTQLHIYSAITGSWPDKSEIYVYGKRLPDSISSYNLYPNGNFLLHLNLNRLKQDNQKMAFNLFETDAELAYRFYSWHCGIARMPEPYQSKGSLVSTIPLLYTYTICRK